MYFSLGRCSFELAQRLSRVALASHIARRGTPFGVTILPPPCAQLRRAASASLCLALRLAVSRCDPLRPAASCYASLRPAGVGPACGRSKRNIILLRHSEGKNKSRQHRSSQRSLQDAPIFRLLLKVAVKGTHQCDFFNFWGSLGLPTTRWQHQGRVWATVRADPRGGEGTCQWTSRHGSCHHNPILSHAHTSLWRLQGLTSGLRLPETPPHACPCD